MTSPAAFQGTYADWKLVKTRGVVQVVIEVPLANADRAYEVLGGMPVAGKERWCAVAAINPNQQSSPSAVAKPDPVSTAPAGSGKRDWRDIKPAEQAFLRCNNATFRAFLKEVHGWQIDDEDEAADAVRSMCEVLSRSELNTNHKARVLWTQFDSEYQAWLAKERVGA